MGEAYPNFSNLKRKGDNGVIGVIGGSIEYTGAPYYSAIASLKSGADLAHVFCHTDAVIPIKCYTPELIVHPGFDNNENSELLDRSIRWFKSMSAFVIGPGLGREDSMKKIFNTILKGTKDLGNLTHLHILDKYHVMDADSLFHFMNNKEDEVIKDIIKSGNDKFIFTPNVNEFQRLYTAFFEDYDKFNMDEEEQIIKNFNLEEEIIEIDLKDDNFKYFEREVKLSKVLGNKIIVLKGLNDVITNGNLLYIVGNKGSSKRCGGIGDILGGIIATIVSMKKSSNLDVMKCIASACFICKYASFKAYEKHHYSLTAPNVIEEISRVLNDLLKDKF